MKVTAIKFLKLSLIALSWCAWGHAEDNTQIKFNKLREMFSFYYLPFNLYFKVGPDINDVFPVTQDKLANPNQPVSPEDMKKIEKEWAPVRESWKKNSLFLSTPVDPGKRVRVSEHLVSHKIMAKHTAMDILPFSERFTLKQNLENTAPEARSTVMQRKLLESFLEEKDKNSFNFFIFSPSWCASSKEYRALFESYFKKLPSSKLTLHSVVIEDPEENIFDSKLMKELFPNTQIYSHDIVPKFLAYEKRDGAVFIYEEGEALSVLYENFFKQHQGFLNKMVSGILPAKFTPENNPFLSPSFAKLPELAK